MYNALILGVARERMARALSLFYGAFNSGVIAGGFLGGLIASRFGLNVPLFCLGAIGIALALLMHRMLSGTSSSTLPTRGKEERSPTAQGTLAAALKLFRVPGFAAAVISVFANLWMFGAVFNTLTPLFARDVLHVSTFNIGVLYAIALAAEFLVYYPAGQWADTRGRRFVLIPSFAFLALSTMVLGFSPTVLIFAVLMAVVGFASGFAGVPPAAVLADVVPVNQSARGVATFRFGADAGYTLGPLVTGLTAATFGFKAAFIAAGLPCLVAFVVVTLSRETLRLPQTA
jgi:MFS family permease